MPTFEISRSTVIDFSVSPANLSAAIETIAANTDIDLDAAPF